MRVIRKRYQAFAGFACVFLLLAVWLFLINVEAAKTQNTILFAGTATACLTFAGLWLHERKNLRIARLITENAILKFHTAVIGSTSPKLAQPKMVEYSQVYISYFGMMLDEKIIKYNQDGIWLREVQIGDQFLSLTFGTQNRMQKVRILKPNINSIMMDELFERFRYETGITPTYLEQEDCI